MSNFSNSCFFSFVSWVGVVVATSHPVAADDAPIFYVGPVSVIVEQRTISNFGKTPRFNSDKSVTLAYRKLGSAVHVTNYVSLPTGGEFRNDRLYRDGEVFQIESQDGNFKDAYFSLNTPAAKTDGRAPTSEDVFRSPSSQPAIGVIDGYPLEDYFPNSSTLRTVQDDGLVRLVADSQYGHAEAWLDASRGSLPVRIVINKTEDHLLAGDRVLGTVRFDQDEPGTLLSQWQFELTESSIDQSDSGEFFVSSCVLVEKRYSQRGFEGTATTTSKVTDIDFDPPFKDSLLRPEFDIRDGRPVSVTGAPQIPYAWSEKEAWPIPNVRNMASSKQASPSRKYIFLIASVPLFLFAIYYLFFRPRTPQQV